MLPPGGEGRQETCRTNLACVTVGPVKHTKKVDLRLPDALREAVELERQRMSKAAGTEVKTSAVIRSILEQKLLTKRARRAA